LFFIISTQEISISDVLRNNVIIGVVCAIILQLRGFEHLNSGAVMGISYGMLPLFLSAISGSICHMQYRTLHLLGLCVLGFIVIWIAPRGVWVSVLAFFAVLCFHYLCRKGDSRKRLMKIVSIIGIAAVVAVVLILNFEKIITKIHYFLLYNFGIRIKALQKFVSVFKQGDVLNGRTVLWDIAKACIEGNLIFGRGIGYYETLAAGSHTHNLLLQALCEGGLLFLVPVCVVVRRSVRYLVFAGNEVKQEDYVFFALLFTCGIVPLIFSSTYWIYVIFWMFLGRYFKIGFRNQFVTENRRC